MPTMNPDGYEISHEGDVQGIKVSLSAVSFVGVHCNIKTEMLSNGAFFTLGPNKC